MKGIACGACFTIRTLQREGWVTCDCGQLSGRWVDPERGIAEFKADDKTLGFGVGFHNTFLHGALRGSRTLMHQDARKLHEQATNAPGYVFDKSMAGCWAIIYRPGSTSDTSWVDEEPPKLPGKNAE